MASTVGKLAFTIGANAGGFNRALLSVRKGIGRVKGLGFSRMLGSITRTGLAATTSMLGLGASVGAVASSIALFRRGMKMEEIERTFASLSTSIGSSAGEFLAKLRNATRGAVSDYELMLAANNAMLLGVAKSDDDYASLASRAMQLGQALNRGPVESLNDITIGIGRQSRLILDNLGILVSAEKANEEYAASIGKAADELTDAEKKTAFFNATLKAVDQSVARLPGNVKSARVSFNKLGASILNIIDRAMVPVIQAASPFVDELAARISEIPIADIASKLLTVFGAVARALAWTVDNIGLVAIAFNLIKTLAAGTAAAVLNMVHGLLILSDELNLLPGDFATARADVVALKKEASEIGFEGLKGIADNFFDLAFGNNSAQNFVNRMIKDIEKNVAGGLGDNASAQADAAAASGPTDPVAFAKAVEQQFNVSPIAATQIAQRLGFDPMALADLKRSLDAESIARGITQAMPSTPAIEEQNAATERQESTRILKGSQDLQRQQLEELRAIREQAPAGARLQ